MKIPIVDFSEYLNGDSQNQKRVSKDLIQAVKTFGFVYLRNYGISNELIKELFDYNKQFFNKPIEYKNLVKKSFTSFCGYDALLEEKLTNKRPGDLKESFMIKRDGTPWPEDWLSFKDFMLNIHSKCYDLALEILRSFAIGLELDENIFKSNFIDGDCTLMRLLHYPQLPSNIEENQIRAGEHTDYGAVTILFQDSVGGLEVKTLDDEWIAAPFVENTVLINIGDVMEMWTNGYLRSTPHRVVNPTDENALKSRYSIAYFCDPDLESEINCIEKFVSEKHPMQYQRKVYKEHLFEKYRNSYEFQDKV
jgi:isopenicillin N synthase-like dioxygenase